MNTTRKIALLAASIGALTLGLFGLAQDRAQRETQVVRVVRKVSPAIVYVSCQQRVQNPFAGSVWDMFGEFPGAAQEENSLGSGVIVDPSGFILTNEHVILSGSKIQVTLPTGKQCAARVVGMAPESDLALLKIDGAPFPSSELGTSSDLMIGETVIAVGNPFGLSNTVTVGILSATGRTVSSGKRRYSDFLQTDAAINPGNSGGALCNVLGQVIGINTAIIKDAQGIGFAIPIDRAKRVMEQLRAFGKVRPVWLGFLPLDLNEGARRRQGLSGGGVLVAKTYPFAFPQAEALRPSDIITSLDGKPLDGTGDLNARLAMATPGQRLELSGIRGSKTFTAGLMVAPLPEELTPAMAWQLLGVKVAEGRRGLVVSEVRRGSPAEGTGLRAGDILLAVEDQGVETPSDFLARARSALTSTGLVLSVARGPWTYYVTLNLLAE